MLFNIVIARMAPNCGGAAAILGCCSEGRGQAGGIGQEEVVESATWSSARNTNSWSRVTPCTGAGWGLSDWEAALQRFYDSVVLASKLNVGQLCAHAVLKANHRLGRINKSVASKAREGYSPL